MFCERTGQVGKSCFDVALIFGEHVADDVRSFKTNGKLSASAGVIRTRKEWRKRLQHRRRGEVESPLAMWTVFADILYEFSGATNCFPMNASFVCDDCTGLHVRKSRERPFEEVHRGRIIGVVKASRSHVRQEILLYGEFVKLAKKDQRLVLRHAGDEFSQRLSRHAHTLYFVTGGFEFGRPQLEIIH